MNDSKITTISIWNDSGIGEPGRCPIYAERMKITSGSISYRREYSRDFEGHKKGETIDYWEIKSNSEDFKEKFNALAARSKSLGDTQIIVDDGAVFTVRVIYEDKKHRTYYLPINFHECDLDHISYLIKKMVPDGYRYSEVLGTGDLEELDAEKLSELISILENEPRIDIQYPKWVWEITELMSPDFEYGDRIKQIKAKEIHIEHFDLDDIRAYLTYFHRGEHFCDGHMEQEIKSGVVLKVLKRLSELCKTYKKVPEAEGRYSVIS